MNRQEAIDHIWWLSRGIAGEFHCSDEEDRELDQQTQAAIDALTAAEPT